MTDTPTPTDTPQVPQQAAFSQAERNAQKRRNLWLALVLFGFVALVLSVTLVRLSMSATMADGGF